MSSLLGANIAGETIEEWEKKSKKAISFLPENKGHQVWSYLST